MMATYAICGQYSKRSNSRYVQSGYKLHIRHNVASLFTVMAILFLEFAVFLVLESLPCLQDGLMIASLSLGISIPYY